MPTVKGIERLRLPEKIQSDGRVTQAGMPRLTAEHFGADLARGLGHLGHVTGQIAGEMAYLKAKAEAAVQEADWEAKSSELVSNAGVLLKEADIRVRETADHTNYVDLFDKEAESIRKNLSKQGTDSKLGRKHQVKLDTDLIQLIGRSKQTAISEQAKLKIDHSRSQGLRSLDEFATQAASADTPEQRNFFEQRGRAAIHNLARSGSINQVEAFEWGERYSKRIKDERVKYFSTDLQNELDDFSNKALRDPVNTAEYHRKGSAAINRAGADWLPPEKLAEVQSNFRDSVWYGGIKGRMDADPIRTLAELRTGKYDQNLSQPHILSLRNEGEHILDGMARKMEAERKDNERRIGKEVNDYKAAVMSGSPWAGNLPQLAGRVRGTEHEAEFLQVQKNSSELLFFNAMSPLQQEEYLRKKAQTPKSGEDAKFFGDLRGAHEATKAQLKTDPMTLEVMRRVIPPPAPLDLTNPDSMRALDISAGIVEQRYSLPTISPLSDQEADELKKHLDAAPADGKVNMFRQLRNGFNDERVRAIAAQLAGKKESITALTMGLSMEAPRAASTILRGQEILKNEPKVGLTGAELTAARDSINSNLGGAYQGNVEHHATITDAALAAYAAKSWQSKDLSGTFNSSRMDEAVNEVTGGLLSIGGGIFSRGYKIQPPRYGMTENDFKDLLNAADYSKAKGFKADDIKKHGIFESLGDGKYLVRVGPGYVQAESGPLVLDLGAIAKRPMEAAKTGGVAGLVK